MQFYKIAFLFLQNNIGDVFGDACDMVGSLGSYGFLWVCVCFGTANPHLRSGKPLAVILGSTVRRNVDKFANS